MDLLPSASICHYCFWLNSDVSVFHHSPTLLMTLKLILLPTYLFGQFSTVLLDNDCLGVTVAAGATGSTGATGTTERLITAPEHL